MSSALRSETIRIRGTVQGVGFRPTVFRVAREHGVRGEVQNDGEGVLIRAWAEPPALDAFVTETIALDEVEKAFERMHHGDVLRSVVVL